MNTIKFTEKGKIKMIAHRGVSGLETENTCAAFVAAGVKSYYGVETDVHLTADGKFLISHDDTLLRVGNVDIRIEDNRFDDLRKIRLQDKDGSFVRADLFPPSLEEYIRICKKYDKQSILEIKGLFPKRKVWEMVEEIKSLGWYEKTTFISFEVQNLVHIRENYADADVQWLLGELEDEHIAYMIERRIDADVSAWAITQEKVQKLHEGGRLVNTWTVDELDLANKVKADGVDFITSNILE